LEKGSGNGIVEANGNGSVEANGNGSVEANGNGSEKGIFSFSCIFLFLLELL
jgi:hypothetical protein